MKKLVLALAVRNEGTRLYGKPLQNLDIQNKFCVLDNIIENVKKLDCVNSIVLGISDGEENKDYINYALRNGIKYIIGDKTDVLSRLIKCAKLENATDVYRITSESPFPYTKLLNDAWIEHCKSNNDATFLDEIIDGCGFEIIKLSALEKSHNYGDDRHRSELCTQYIRENMNNFKVKIIQPPKNLIRKDLRLTVDNPEDLVLCRAVYNELKGKNNFELEDIISFLDNNEHLKKLTYKFCETGYQSMYIRSKSSSTGQELWKKAKKIIPGGNMLLSKNPDNFLPTKWPSYYSRTKGCKVWDLDNNCYIDMSIMGIGTNILGYNNEEVDREIYKVIQKGNMSTFNCPEEVELAENLINIHPWAEMAKFARTGGEANSIAVRIARITAKNDKIAVCGYHGWHDWYLAANVSDNENLAEHLMPGLPASGVPKELKKLIFPFKYNNLEELKKIIEKEDIGIIKMEVSRTDRPKDNFLKNVRTLANKHNIILIFDECTSGFRETFGGLHLKYNVTPDIAIFGKALGNGYAITSIIGKKDIMKHAKNTFISSTFWTERIGPVAALKTLEIMKRSESWNKITNIGKKIQDQIRILSKRHNLDIHISGLPSLTNFNFNSKDNNKYKTLITQDMLKENFLASNIIYVCTEHNDEIVSQYFFHLDKIFSKIKECEDGRNIDDLLETKPANSGFKRLN